MHVAEKQVRGVKVNRFAVPNATVGLPGKPTNGGSGPRFYDFDDGVVRLVKWHPSYHGARLCYNELVASRLGQLISAPILRGSVVYIPEEIIPQDHLPYAKKGFQFGVTRMDGENFQPAAHYGEIENKAELCRAAVLLAWLSVEDHEGRNQYLQRLDVKLGGTKRRQSKLFRLIDMGFAFADGDWRAETVAGISDAYVLPSHIDVQLRWPEVKAAIDDLKSVSADDIRACLQDFPPDWNVPPADVQALEKRVLEARDLIEDMISNGNPGLRSRA